jgi:hypothetical protein
MVASGGIRIRSDVSRGLPTVGLGPQDMPLCGSGLCTESLLVSQETCPVSNSITFPDRVPRTKELLQIRGLAVCPQRVCAPVGVFCFHVAQRLAFLSP